MLCEFYLKDGSEYDIGGPIGRCDHYVVVGMRLAIFTTGAHEPPKAAKERVTSVPCKYKLVTYFRV